MAIRKISLLHLIVLLVVALVAMVIAAIPFIGPAIQKLLDDAGFNARQLLALIKKICDSPWRMTGGTAGQQP